MTTCTHTVSIYTDGACSRNPGPGGYGAVLIRGHQRLELSGGFRNTTNNRMEMLACIEGLKVPDMDGEEITVYSDSRYIVDAINAGSARLWRDNGWMRTRKDRAKNPDLWEALLNLCDRHNPTFVWVAGHDGNVENERCDVLAVEARLKDGLPPDEGYEHPVVPEDARQQMLLGL